MKFLLATKENMTQFFNENGDVIPATVLSAGPLVVTQVKTKEHDGYDAIQVGFGERREKNVTKPLAGHMRHGKEEGRLFRSLREFRFPENGGERPVYNVGDVVDVSIFTNGDDITASGTTKGKGFQGVVKRHGFHGGPRTHGQKHSEREPGSIGATGPQRVFKGVRMAGRMGGNRVSVKGLKVLAVSKEDNTLLVSGSVPGRRGTLIELRG
jgi:large subunit ribosomal protein L3